MFLSNAQEYFKPADIYSAKQIRRQYDGNTLYRLSSFRVTISKAICQFPTLDTTFFFHRTGEGLSFVESYIFFEVGHPLGLTFEKNPSRPSTPKTKGRHKKKTVYFLFLPLCAHLTTFYVTRSLSDYIQQ